MIQSASEITYSRMLHLAVPIMLANISVPLVGIVDTAVMGRMPQADWLAAVAIGATVFSTLFWLFGFLRMGTGGQTAQAFGRGDSDAIRLVFYRALYFALICSVVLLLLQVPLFTLSTALLTPSEQVSSLVADYFFIRIWSAPATLTLYAVTGTLIGLQRMRAVLLNQLLLNCINVVLNLYFFFELGWGIKGVALSSVISDYIAVVTGLLLINQSLPLTRHALFHPQTRQLSQLLAVARLNSDLLIRTLCLSLAFYWITLQGAQLGTGFLAANAILIQLVHAMAYGLDGFSHAVETLTGYAYGRRNLAMFHRSVKTGTHWGLAMAIVIAIIYALAGAQLIDWLTTLDETRNLAKIYLPWIVFSPLIAIWSFILDGVYIGVTHTRDMRNAMIVSLLVYVAISIPLVRMFGNNGIWMSYYVLMICRSTTLSLFFHRITRQIRQNQPEYASREL